MQRVKQLLQSPKPVKWLFHGDSITHGALHTFGFRDYSELFSERIRYEMNRKGDIVIKSAFSGNTTLDLLGDFDWRVGSLQPNVVFLMIGMNDCSAGRKIPREEFRGNLETLCRKIMDLNGAVTVLQTTCPIIPGRSADREPNFDSYMDAVREVAAAQRLPLIDHTRYWRNVFAEKGAGLHQYWMSDAFHPNNFGHQVFAEFVFKELGIFDPDSFCCRLFRP
jgi:lysophospholipase L1-like esterase